MLDGFVHPKTPGVGWLVCAQALIVIGYMVIGDFGQDARRS
jgi:hypothetical protein